MGIRWMAMAWAAWLVGCGAKGTPEPASADPPRTRTLTLAAYTIPREAYGEIIPLFRRHYRELTGDDVVVNESYEASGAQARAVVGGFEADVVALSHDQDVQKVRDAGLITHDYRQVGPYRGIVSNSVVVLAVRAGNPKNVRDWIDLTREDVAVITPNVRTSGGAMWNIAAVYGAALRGHVDAREGSAETAEDFLGRVLARVHTMDRSGRESMDTYERGVGDVAISYENEVFLGRDSGQTYVEVVPRSTLLIENPAAIVDANVEKHGSRDVAEAFLAFLTSAEAQRVFARRGFRPVDETIRRETASRFPVVQDLFTVRDLGDWAGLDRALFGRGAGYDRASARLANQDR